MADITNTRKALLTIPILSLFAALSLFFAPSVAFAESDLAAGAIASIETQSSNWETEVNDSTGKANNIDLNTAYYGTISRSSSSYSSSETDYDYFTFHLSSASKVAVTFRHPYRNTSMGQWKVRILDSGGSQLMIRTIAGDETSVTLTPLGLPSGDYFVEVMPNSSSYWSSATYNFTVGATKTSVWEKEVNDGTTLASYAALNTAYYGTISRSSSSYSSSETDHDFYRFHLSSTKKTTLTFRHPYRNTSMGQWRVRVLNSNGSELASRDVVGTTTSTSLQLGNLPSGDYFIEVTPYSGSYWSSATYNFRISA